MISGLNSARRPAVISSPDSGVSAVAAEGVLWAFGYLWRHYLNTVFAAESARIPLSMLFSNLAATAWRLCGYIVYAADVLVRRGLHRGDFR